MISNYLKTLRQNGYTINDTQSFSQELSTLPTMEDEEDVSYEVESLFTYIRVKETIYNIID